MNVFKPNAYCSRPAWRVVCVVLCLALVAMHGASTAQVQPSIAGLPAPKPEPTERPAPAPAPQQTSPGGAQPKAPAASARTSAQAGDETERRRELRAKQLDRLAALDLQIEEARKQGELVTARERIQPGYQLPTYMAVFGMPGQMRAVLVSATGGQMTVGQGDRIARGVVVSAITSSGVELGITEAKGGTRRVALDAAATANTGAAPAPALVPPQPIQPTPLPPLVQSAGSPVN